MNLQETRQNPDMLSFSRNPRHSYKSKRARNPLALKHYNNDETVRRGEAPNVVRFSGLHTAHLPGTGATRSVQPRYAALGRRVRIRGKIAAQASTRAVRVFTRSGAPFYGFPTASGPPRETRSKTIEQALDEWPRPKRSRMKTGGKALCGNGQYVLATARHAQARANEMQLPTSCTMPPPPRSKRR